MAAVAAAADAAAAVEAAGAAAADIIVDDNDDDDDGAASIKKNENSREPRRAQINNFVGSEKWAATRVLDGKAALKDAFNETQSSRSC